VSGYRKVFIVESAAELQQFEPVMTQQSAAKIHVKHIYYKTIFTDNNLIAKRKRIGNNIDFGLFDSGKVLLWLLNEKTRQVEGGRVLFGTEHFNPYSDFFEAIFDEAADFQPRDRKRRASN
jgi:hypothetical protein